MHSFNHSTPVHFKILLCIYYIKLQCPFVCRPVCMSVCLFPLFSTRPSDCNQIWHAYMRIDPGIIRTQKYLTHSTLRSPRGDFRGSKIQQKSGKCRELPRKSVKKLTPTPVLGGQRFGKCHELPRKLIHFVTPQPHPPGRGSFRGHNFSIKF